MTTIPQDILKIKGLYIVSTPIGNKNDITIRAIETLKAVDLIACEDTRVTGKLLNVHLISTKMQSYHEYNALKIRPKLLKKLENGRTIALVSDAGTPLISDPGYKFIQSCLQKNIPVTTVPGPCAPIAALTVSGLATNQFFFAGFAPSKSLARQEFFRGNIHNSGTQIYFESAQRLLSSLKDMFIIFGNRQAVIARELTKKFEEILRGSLEDLISHYQNSETPKGEIVILIEEEKTHSSLTDQMKEIIRCVQKSHSTRSTVELINEISPLPRKIIYDAVLALHQEDKK